MGADVHTGVGFNAAFVYVLLMTISGESRGSHRQFGTTLTPTFAQSQISHRSLQLHTSATLTQGIHVVRFWPFSQVSAHCALGQIGVTAPTTFSPAHFPVFEPCGVG